MLHRLESFDIELTDSLLPNACHKTVLRSDLVIFVPRLGFPLVVFLVQALNPGPLLIRSQWDGPL